MAMKAFFSREMEASSVHPEYWSKGHEHSETSVLLQGRPHRPLSKIHCHHSHRRHRPLHPNHWHHRGMPRHHQHHNRDHSRNLPGNSPRLHDRHLHQSDHRPNHAKNLQRLHRLSTWMLLYAPALLDQVLLRFPSFHGLLRPRRWSLHRAYSPRPRVRSPRFPSFAFPKVSLRLRPAVVRASQLVLQHVFPSPLFRPLRFVVPRFPVPCPPVATLPSVRVAPRSTPSCVCSLLGCTRFWFRIRSWLLRPFFRLPFASLLQASSNCFRTSPFRTIRRFHHSSRKSRRPRRRRRSSWLGGRSFCSRTSRSCKRSFQVRRFHPRNRSNRR
mmetsp:Transcript_2843/g.17689  ORF Transcript_2843/g.17689 Transcript_2843/m.17689 type:complete len:327 (+) Transcript_2843:983-1963(+)